MSNFINANIYACICKAGLFTTWLGRVKLALAQHQVHTCVCSSHLEDQHDWNMITSKDIGHDVGIMRPVCKAC